MSLITSARRHRYRPLFLYIFMYMKKHNIASSHPIPPQRSVWVCECPITHAVIIVYRWHINISTSVICLPKFQHNSVTLYVIAPRTYCSCIRHCLISSWWRHTLKAMSQNNAAGFPCCVCARGAFDTANSETCQPLLSSYFSPAENASSLYTAVGGLHENIPCLTRKLYYIMSVSFFLLFFLSIFH